MDVCAVISETEPVETFVILFISSLSHEETIITNESKEHKKQYLK
jgi:hypothetical protein